MPGRRTPLVTDEIYHVFNRGIDRCPTFVDKHECNRALTTISYYQFIKPAKKLSYFLLTPSDERIAVFNSMRIKNEKLVDIMAFCLMPNHFHFLLKQVANNGISQFMSYFQNSYTKYFNVKNDRDGGLFLNLFKANRIETDEQLIHVSRYIHLNPLTSFVVKNFVELKRYQWSSLPDYLHPTQASIITTTPILSLFSKQTSYEAFVHDQGGYQRQLHVIKHLLLE